MALNMSTEEYFKRFGYSLNTSVDEALAIKARHPTVSDEKIAEMNILTKRQKAAETRDWGMYSVTVNNLANVYRNTGDNERLLECLLQSFYLTLAAGRSYTPVMMEMIASAAFGAGLQIEDVPAAYSRAVSMLPPPMITVEPSRFCSRLADDLDGYEPEDEDDEVD